MNILELNSTEIILIYFGIAAVLLIILLIVALKLVSVKRKKKMYTAIEALLNEYVKADPLYAKLERVNSPEYDYILTTKELKVYIMVIPNFQSGEISINAPTKWQYRKSYKDEGMHYIPRVESLMRFDPPSEVGLRTKRLYIIYPSSKSLLRYINECEMEFVRPETDLNGTSVITYSELLEHKDTIEL